MKQVMKQCMKSLCFWKKDKGFSFEAVQDVVFHQVLVTKDEVMRGQWRHMNPRNCPVIERTGDGDSVGACWFYLKDGVCPRHGRIYGNKS